MLLSEIKYFLSCAFNCPDIINIMIRSDKKRNIEGNLRDDCTIISHKIKFTRVRTSYLM
jgi:hypothetical protein